eukprot:jgi/Botrbrau1/12243/Bobra.0361s0007.1
MSNAFTLPARFIIDLFRVQSYTKCTPQKRKVQSHHSKMGPLGRGMNPMSLYGVDRWTSLTLIKFWDCRCCGFVLALTLLHPFSFGRKRLCATILLKAMCKMPLPWLLLLVSVQRLWSPRRFFCILGPDAQILDIRKVAVRARV